MEKTSLQRNTNHNRVKVDSDNPGRIDLDVDSATKMVEETLSQIQEYPTRDRLMNALPQSISYDLLNLILKQLEDSGKILADKDGSLVWIAANSPELKKLHDEFKANPVL